MEKQGYEMKGKRHIRDSTVYMERKRISSECREVVKNHFKKGE